MLPSLRRRVHQRWRWEELQEGQKVIGCCRSPAQRQDEVIRLSGQDHQSLTSLTLVGSVPTGTPTPPPTDMAGAWSSSESHDALLLSRSDHRATPHWSSSDPAADQEIRFLAANEATPFPPRARRLVSSTISADCCDRSPRLPLMHTLTHVHS